MKKLKIMILIFYLLRLPYLPPAIKVNITILQSNVFFLLYKKLKRLICIQCPFNEFTINQNEQCEKCVAGGICDNGILSNKAGKF